MSKKSTVESMKLSAKKAHLFADLFKTLYFPVLLLDVFGGIVGIVWLIFAGQFKFVLFSVLLSIFVPHILTLLEIPAIIICSFLEKKIPDSIISNIFMIIASAIDSILICGYIWIVVQVVISYGNNTPVSVVPYLLMGYGVFTAPLQFMLSQENRLTGGNAGLGTYVGLIGAKGLFLLLLFFYFFNIMNFSLLVTIIFVAILVLVKHIISRMLGRSGKVE